ncbi:hypothetical protein [Aliiglaciecola sp. LCG003]|uniref:hypothetical protein n=1 Tax=Aliiglaciecola sp. LCG003 TaxID=3053655 RepID=UPI002573691E|nr:hypothetical protein [Aliiglaciecola sp. LCG003]WJG10354.1 hypothetical protein QR722_04770 [Aliiglaciecola sp. LCG003]
MKMPMSKILLTICFLLVGLCSIVGCSNQLSESIRKVTYPPEFKYVEPAELRSNMARLAQQMRILDSALALNTEEQLNGAELQQEQVMTALHNIERIASKLQAGDAGASHPFLQDFMRDFVSKVDEARVAASLQEPRFYFAGKLAGGCVNCHKINR